MRAVEAKCRDTISLFSEFQPNIEQRAERNAAYAVVAAANNALLQHQNASPQLAQSVVQATAFLRNVLHSIPPIDKVLTVPEYNDYANDLNNLVKVNVDTRNAARAAAV